MISQIVAARTRMSVKQRHKKYHRRPRTRNSRKQFVNIDKHLFTESNSLKVTVYFAYSQRKHCLKRLIDLNRKRDFQLKSTVKWNALQGDNEEFWMRNRL